MVGGGGEWTKRKRWGPTTQLQQLKFLSLPKTAGWLGLRNVVELNRLQNLQESGYGLGCLDQRLWHPGEGVWGGGQDSGT